MASLNNSPSYLQIRGSLPKESKKNNYFFEPAASSILHFNLFNYPFVVAKYILFTFSYNSPHFCLSFIGSPLAHLSSPPYRKK